MSRRAWVAGVVATIAVAVAALLAIRLRAALDVPYAGWTGEAVVVEIPRNVGASQAIDRLARAGVIGHPRLARVWLLLGRSDGTLRAGEYRFEHPASLIEVLERLRRGDVLLHAVTLPEGLTLPEVARRLEAAGFGTAPEHLATFADPSSVADLDPAATDLEGYLFPDTYRFPKGETSERIARAMVKRFREVTGDAFASRAAAAGLTPREAVVLASLVEEETSVPEERGRISRVFHNRLKRGMLLQCDPTVLYALRREGREVERLLKGHLAFPSPWNTYRQPGLPPGPICSPGKESLEAAVEPAEGDDLYFVAAPGGGHVFSRDLASHNRAVARWRRYGRSSR